jgi:transmembrane sensor
LRADYVTGAGETMLVRLPDGSVMHLAADSAVQLAQDGARRGVRLLAGEAFFQVVPDAGRPFIVAAGDLSATDVGTAFDVRLASAGAAVAVREGLVDVSYEKATPPLRNACAPATGSRSAGAAARLRAAPLPRSRWVPGRAEGWLSKTGRSAMS